MDPHVLRLRSIAATMRAVSDADIDHPDVFRGRCDAASIIRSAITSRALIIPDLAEQLVRYDWHRHASDVNDTRAPNFFTAVAVWCYSQFRGGLLPAGQHRNEVEDYANICEILAGMIAVGDRSYDSPMDKEAARLREAATDYMNSMHPDSELVARSIARLQNLGHVSGEASNHLRSFVLADANGEHREASESLLRLIDSLDGQQPDEPLPHGLILLEGFRVSRHGRREHEIDLSSQEVEMLLQAARGKLTRTWTTQKLRITASGATKKRQRLNGKMNVLRVWLTEGRLWKLEPID